MDPVEFDPVDLTTEVPDVRDFHPWSGNITRYNVMQRAQRMLALQLPLAQHVPQHLQPDHFPPWPYVQARLLDMNLVHAFLGDTQARLPVPGLLLDVHIPDG